MDILNINNNEVQIRVSEEESVSVLDISKEQLFKILDNVYENEEYYNLELVGNELASIKNPVKKVIAEQILDKIQDFKKQVGALRTTLSAKYPEIHSEIEK